jgi:hypothetical protein
MRMACGALVAKGNPKKITGINPSLCGTTAAENTGYVEVPLIQNLTPACKALPEHGASYARAVYNYRWTPQRDPFGVVHPTIDYPASPSTIRRSKRTTAS